MSEKNASASISTMRVADLREYAKSKGIKIDPKAKKADIIAAIREVEPARRGRPRKEAEPVRQVEAAPQAAPQEDEAAVAPESEKAEATAEQPEAGANTEGQEDRDGQREGRTRRDRAKENDPAEPKVPASVDEIVLPDRSGEGAESAEERSGGRRSRTRSRSRRERNGNGVGQNQQRDRNDRQERPERQERKAELDAIGDSAERRSRQGQQQAQNHQAQGQQGEEYLIPVAGILDKQGNAFFLRTGGYLPGTNDAIVPVHVMKQYGLRRGDAVVGAVREPNENQNQYNRRRGGRNGNNNRRWNNGQPRHKQLVQVDAINGLTPEKSAERPEFGKLTPLYPQEMIRLETDTKGLTTRAIDLVAPVGKGQRGLIVSPPKAGKTMTMQQIATAIAKNDPSIHIMVVLVDERPEEVTDMQRLVCGEVISSTFDRPASDHTIVAELAIERAKRLVELGQDVVVLLDSLTRLSRAYNLAAPASGRILSGGVDAAALYPPKKFFGAARNIENGGSLTIIASALVETGSKMDEVIFEEFKGTGNMELRLSRQLADRRIFPAIDVNASGTRREELLYSPEELKVIWQLRRGMGMREPADASDFFLKRLRATESNGDFLVSIMRQLQNAGTATSV